MRECAGCGVVTTADNTYKSITKWCKACWRAKVRARRRTNPAVREYDRERSKLPHRRKIRAKVSKKWRDKNPAAYKAQAALGNAVRDGKIKKEPCLFCEAVDHVHAHHRDYSRPLDVVWVCAKCHHRLHALEAA